MSNLCFRPYFFPFCRTEAALLPCNDNFPTFLFRHSYHFYILPHPALATAYKLFPFFVAHQSHFCNSKISSVFVAHNFEFSISLLFFKRRKSGFSSYKSSIVSVLPYLFYALEFFIYQSGSFHFSLRFFLFYKPKLQIMLIATNTVQRPKKYFQVSIICSCEVEAGERNLLHHVPSTHELIFKPVASFHYGYKECKKSTSLQCIACNLHSASCYLYNVRA